MCRSLLIILAIFAVNLCAQENQDSSVVLKQILDRLDTLEKENRALVQEVHTLRQQLEVTLPQPKQAAEAEGPGGKKDNQPTVNERLDVEEHRTAEQAQTKVEAAHKFPIQLNGMLLFNAFANGEYYGLKDQTEYSALTGPNSSGATFRQTLLGLQFQGPRLPGDGRVSGSLMMDFWGGTSDPALSWLRLRTADVSFDWQNRSVSFRLDKPLISPYQPDSLAEVGIPPLAGAGNLWLWLPQIRYEEKMHINGSNGFTGQLAVLQTKETYAVLPPSYASTLEPARPALEGRLSFWHRVDDTRRFEIGSGFHFSTTHVAGGSVPSRIGSLDWLIVPATHFRLSGTFFGGQNVASLGGLGNGFTIVGDQNVVPMSSLGGWAQVAVPITSRLTWNVYAGLEDDYAAKVYSSYTGRNLAYASNVMYHLGSNVIVSLEAMQMRPQNFSGSTQLQHHYDLAVGYLF
jgi:hypothetical protein